MSYKLREISRKDMVTINKWRNDENLIALLGAPFRYIDIEIDEAWFDNYLNNRSKAVRCVIVDDKDMVIGLVSLTDIDNINRSATFHIMIGDSSHQNKGAGQFAIKEMLNHAFNNLNLHRIQLEVLSSNDRAIHVYEKLGFVKEGTLRQVYFKNGKYVDALVMGIINNSD